MTSSKMAEYLDGKDIYSIGEREAELAARNDLIIIYGAPFDAIQVHGCIEEEFNSLEDPVLYLNRDGFFAGCPYGDVTCQYCSEALRRYRKIEMNLSDNGGATYCEFETDMSHETFELYDGNDLCCIGIVIAMCDI